MNSFRPTRILITAGATREPFDEVRYLGNRSSGQLGVLIALSAAIKGYEVTLLHDSHCISPTSHPRLQSIPFTSIRDLSAKLMEQWPSAHVLIMAAAVADFTPKGGQIDGKINRADSVTLELTSTDDIVEGVASCSRNDQRIIAFSLATSEQLEETAHEKMKRKRVDAIVANPLQTMEAKEITATIYCNDGRSFTPQKNLPKAAFARWLIDNLEQILLTT